MENAVEALETVAWMLLFVLALSISITLFGQANTAFQTIINYGNNRTLYTYVEPSEATTREVGIETIIPTMYRAYIENYSIYFLNSDGSKFELYREEGNVINYIDLDKEVWGSNPNTAMEHLDKVIKERYDELKKHTFKEEIGEYYIEDKTANENGTTSDTAQVNKTKKRVITYTVLN